MKWLSTTGTPANVGTGLLQIGLSGCEVANSKSEFRDSNFGFPGLGNLAKNLTTCISPGWNSFDEYESERLKAVLKESEVKTYEAAR